MDDDGKNLTDNDRDEVIKTCQDHEGHLRSEKSPVPVVLRSLSALTSRISSVRALDKEGDTE